MMDKHTTLNVLKKGQRATISSIAGASAMIFNHFLAFGLVEGSEVEVRGSAPLGDPMTVRAFGTEISLRKADAAGIKVVFKE